MLLLLAFHFGLHVVPPLFCWFSPICTSGDATKKRLSILVGLLLFQNCVPFAEDIIEWHLPCPYQSKMCFFSSGAYCPWENICIFYLGTNLCACVCDANDGMLSFVVATYEGNHTGNQPSAQLSLTITPSRCQANLCNRRCAFDIYATRRSCRCARNRQGDMLCWDFVSIGIV